jgi:hypothetical protein
MGPAGMLGIEEPDITFGLWVEYHLADRHLVNAQVV